MNRACVLAAVLSGLALCEPAATSAQPPPPKPKPRATRPAPPAPASDAAVSRGRLLVVADAAGRLWLDGKPMGAVAADEPRSFAADSGSHIVLLLSQEGDVRREVEVAVTPGQQHLVRIDLRDEVERERARHAERASTLAAGRALEDRARRWADAPWRRIEPGTVLVGCVPADHECLDDERPRRQVLVPAPFEIMTAEVTVYAFDRFARDQGVPPPAQPEWNDRPDHPVVNVRWAEAHQFCAAAGGRLPTEVEWEHAARGTRPDTTFSWGDAFLATFANGSGTPPGDRWPYTAPVGSLEPNDRGVFDMSGNVWEWVAGTDAVDGVPSARRLARGGSWQSIASALRTSVRARLDPERGHDTVGFRCVRDVRAGAAR